MTIGINFEITENGTISINNLSGIKKERRHKGKSLLEIPEQFCVIDIETTGLDPSFDSIIEISALHIKNNVVAETFSSLVLPKFYHILSEEDLAKTEDYILKDGQPIQYVNSFITKLTGITNEMLEAAPPFKNIQAAFLEFIGSNTLIGHNVNFDINFLYDNLCTSNIILDNNYLDTRRLSRRLLPDLPNYKLKTLAKHWGIDITGSHRAEKDCYITFEVLKCLNSLILEKFGTYDTFAKTTKTYSGDASMIKDITTNKTEFDKSHPCFGKEFVFTGKLEKMPRKDAMQFVIDLGGKCNSNVTKNTNFLVLGNNDYCSMIKDGKSNKQKKAEDYKLKGFDIEILSESVFYDILDE